ncbi:hypothetical protein GRJ2_000509100 [Grus japonensis]|uniref:Uncharacterized protein n=1 Tax=Grus japonensis TaxID=30415 RepID=A0ABC9W4H8_GRUJA
MVQSNKAENKQRWQEACVDEQGAPDRAQTSNGSIQECIGFTWQGFGSGELQGGLCEERLGLSHARQGRFQMAPQWTHCRTQLSPSGNLVVSLGKHIYERGKTLHSEEQRKKCEKQSREHQGQRRRGRWCCRCQGRCSPAAHEQTMVEQVSTLQALEMTTLEQVDISWRNCSPLREGGWFSQQELGPIIEGTKLEQVYPEEVKPMERTHTGTILEGLQPWRGLMLEQRKSVRRKKKQQR